MLTNDRVIELCLTVLPGFIDEARYRNYPPLIIMINYNIHANIYKIFRDDFQETDIGKTQETAVKNLSC